MKRKPSGWHKQNLGTWNQLPTSNWTAWDDMLRELGLTEKEAIRMAKGKTTEAQRIMTWVRKNAGHKFVPQEFLFKIGADYD